MQLKPKLIYIVLLCNLFASGQKIKRSALYGEWQLSCIQKDTLDPDKFNGFYSLRFYNNGYLERVQVKLPGNVLTGALKKDTLREIFKVNFKKRNREFTLTNTGADDHVYFINEVDSFNLDLSFYDPFEQENPNVSYIFIRTDYTDPGSYSALSADSVPYLFNLFDSTKKIRANPGDGEFNLSMTETKGDSVISSAISGELLAVKDSMLTFRVKDERIEIVQKDILTGHITMSYKSDSVIRIYKMKDVTLEFVKPRNTALTTIGGFLGSYGGVHALFIAPLVSFNYSRSTMDSEEYIANVALGLSCLVVGITLSVLPDTRTYHIGPPRSAKDKNSWYFKKIRVNF